MIMRRLARGNPSVVRQPDRYDNLLILEETSYLPANYKKGDIMKSHYCLVLDVSMPTVLKALNGLKEAKITSKDLLALVEYKLNLDFNCENLSQIEQSVGFGFNFYMKKSNIQEYRSIFNRVQKSENSDLPQLNLLVTSR